VSTWIIPTDGSGLYYGMEACLERKSQFKSLDFVINSALRKFVDTKSKDIVDARR